MSEKEIRCGGVVIRNDGRVLLREPTGHPEGTAWRFPTGKLSEKEPPEATVERVVQRIGTTARVVARIPGTFEGTSSLTTYFRMDFLGENGRIDPKTARVCWATLMEAQDMINAASSLPRRRRDLAVLEAVLRMSRVDEMIVPAKCSNTRREFLAVFRRERDGWALSKSVTPGEDPCGATTTEDMRNIRIAAGYDGCTFCGSRNVFFCNRCQTLNCMGSSRPVGEQTFVDCASCGLLGVLARPGSGPGMVLRGTSSNADPGTRPRGRR
jgi:hypothetical protein